MKNQNQFFALLAVLGIWHGASTVQAQSSVAVGAWGNNDHGQTAVPTAAQNGVMGIAAGGIHTVALRSDGSVVAWGDNHYGQTDVPISAQSGVTAIAAGFDHTLALKNDGSVVTWGTGLGQTNVPDAAQNGVIAIAAGASHAMALKNDGTVVVWGNNDNGQVTGTNAPYFATASPITLGGQVLSGVTAIAAGYYHSAALTKDGTVVAWGNNTSGQVTGIRQPADATGDAIANPVTLNGQVLRGVTALAAGSFHTVALKSDGTIVAWGSNSNGQTTVPVAAQSGVVAIAAGSDHTVALKSDGSMLAWGNNDSGQTTVPAGLGRVTAVAAGGAHTMELVVPTAPTITTAPASQTVIEWQSASFTVTAAGYPLYYQWDKDGVALVGPSSAIYHVQFALTNHAGNYTVVVRNPAGIMTSAPPAMLKVNAAIPQGTVVAWGNNHSGQTDVPVAAQSGVKAIAAGGIHDYGDLTVGYTLALRNDGSVVGWGATNSHFSADGLYTVSNVPNAAQRGVTAISAADFHAMALKKDGTVVAWGDNTSGQVTGSPATNDSHSAIASPVILNGQVLNGVTAVAAAGLHSFALATVGHSVALKSDGTVVAWGNNYFGQVSGMRTTNTPAFAMASPVILDGQILSNVTAIAARAFHTVALKNNGTVVAWGNNYYGQVSGIPSTDAPDLATASSIANAVQLRGEILSGVISISAGENHSVALKQDGTVVAWGADYSGQVTGSPSTNAPYFAIANPVKLEDQVLTGVVAIAAGGSHTLALKNDGTVVAWGANLDGQATGSPSSNAPYFATANPVTLGSRVLSGVTAIAASYIHSVALLGTAPLLPSLQVRSSGNRVIFSWPTNAADFTLQSTADLTPPVTWTDSSNSYGVIGTQLIFTNSAHETARYFRLLKQ